MDSLSKSSSPILSSTSIASTLPTSRPIASIRVSSNPNPIAKPVHAASTAVILAALVAGNLSAPPPSLADPIRRPETLADPIQPSSPAVGSLKSLLVKKLADGDNSAALALVSRLALLQPAEPEWKLLSARLHGELGDAGESRAIYEEILAADPGSFEARFELALLVERCGEGDANAARLESALASAGSAREARMIAALVKLLEKEAEEALAMYDELAEEDPEDYRPWFCRGVICSLLGRSKEAREMFAKYRRLAPNKFELDPYFQNLEAKN